MSEGPQSPFLEIIEGETLLANRFSTIHRMDNSGGDGFFSLMFTAIDQKSGKKVALKFFDPSKMNDTNRYKRFEREAKMLVELKDEPLVVNPVGGGLNNLSKVFIDSHTKVPFNLELPYFALEWADSNIEKFIYSSDPEPISLLLTFKEMVKSIFRLHMRKICHRDIKPNNFLLSNNRIKLSDLGTAKNMGRSEDNISLDYQYFVGHKDYIAPELIASVGIADKNVFKADIFSLGAVLFEMFTKVVFTSQIYSADNLYMLLGSLPLLFKMTPGKRLETYSLIVEDIAGNIQVPDIYLYGDRVPACIRLHLNELYKSMVEINYLKRNSNPISIHRKIDICIKILNNETKYSKWLEEKKRRRLTRQSKLD